MIGGLWIRKDAEESWSGLILMYSLGICLEGLRKTTNTPSQDGQAPGQNLSPVPPEYETGVLTTRPRRSVLAHTDHFKTYHKFTSLPIHHSSIMPSYAGVSYRESVVK
jgi:hypothetical protein